MGNIEVCPCMGRDPNEKEIALKENTLMMHKFTSVQIKNAFFQKYTGTIISYENVMKAMERLTEECVGANTLYKVDKDGNYEVKKTFQALLKGVIDGEVTDKIETCNFKFQPLMIMLILLSKSISKDRIQGILQIEGLEKFTPAQLTNSLELIFKTVCDCSLQMILSSLEEENKKKEEKEKYQQYEKQIQQVVKDSIENIYQGSSDKTPLELGIMFYQLNALMQYDAASTSGIRKILKQYTQKNLPKKEEQNQQQKAEATQGEPQKPEKDTEQKQEVKQEETTQQAQA